VFDEQLTPPSLENPSQLSRFFASLRHLPSPEDRTQASLADVADSACRSLHHASQKHKPCAKMLLEGLNMADRQETLVWLVQAFDVMHFSDSLLYDTALLLDRYYACLPREDIRSGESQRKLLAAVCMALKTGSNAETQLPLRQVVTHLGHGQVPFDEVMSAELAMLRKLRFDVGTPTARDFLEALSTRLSVFRVSDACRSLAEFLLQLSLMDAVLHYRYPHAVLAASALYLALSTTRAPAAAHMALLEDLALHCPEAALPTCPSSSSLAQCVAALHSLWNRSTSGAERSLYSRDLYSKFAKANFQEVSKVQPPLTPPAILQVVQQSLAAQNVLTVQNVPASSSTVQVQDEVEEAVSIVHHSLASDFGAYSSGDHMEERRCAHCRSCDRTWLLPEPHGGLCTDCNMPVEVVFAMEASSNSSRDPQQWATTLAARLRSTAESSWKVRCVLARHGWAQGRFRRLPDREQLLRDLHRASRGTRPSSSSMAAAAAAAVVAAERGVSNKENHAPSRGNCNQQVAEGGQRRQRASSWCGQRSTRSSDQSHRGMVTRSP